jgi:hypothetical protein
METMSIILIPFLAMIAFNSMSCNPLDLVFIVKNAAIAFHNSHSSNKELNYKDATIASRKIMRWVHAVNKIFIKETRFDADPDNKELQIYANKRHRKCNLHSLEQGSFFGTTSQGASNSAISQLVAANNRNNKVCEETNKLQKCDQDNVKKNRTNDLHPSIRTMIKNGSATKYDKPGEIYTNF